MSAFLTRCNYSFYWSYAELRARVGKNREQNATHCKNAFGSGSVVFAVFVETQVEPSLLDRRLSGSSYSSLVTQFHGEFVVDVQHRKCFRIRYARLGAKA